MKVWKSPKEKWIWRSPSIGMCLSTFSFLVFLWVMTWTALGAVYLVFALVCAAWVWAELNIAYRELEKEIRRL
jgi:hypothetical protein